MAHNLPLKTTADWTPGKYTIVGHKTDRTAQTAQKTDVYPVVYCYNNAVYNRLVLTVL